MMVQTALKNYPECYFFRLPFSTFCIKFACADQEEHMAHPCHQIQTRLQLTEKKGPHIMEIKILDSTL